VGAMAMTRAEQKKKMAALRHEVRTHDVAWWADQILSDLASLRSTP
jgi:trehalose-6-phosphate synthase